MSPRWYKAAYEERVSALPARRHERLFRAELTGFQEVPPKLTNATGTFQARVAGDGRSIDFELRFANLTSSSAAAHIHFGQPGVNGEVAAFLCGGDTRPGCPGTGGLVLGTIRPPDVLGIPSQGLAPGDIAGLVRIMRAGLAYVNVHSTVFPGGEIRGQVRYGHA